MTQTVEIPVENHNNTSNFDAIVSVRGSVVDVRFDKYLPSIYTLLRAGNERKIAIGVLNQLDTHHVRGIAMTPTEGLARGMAVEYNGGPLKTPVARGILANVRRVWKYHRPKRITVRYPMALNT